MTASSTPTGTAEPSLDPAPTENPHHARGWLILGVIGLAQLMVTLDMTVVNIALPSAQRDLGFGNDSRQWIVTAYSLAFGSLLLLGGRLSDLLGRKRTFLVGLVGFVGASTLGGAAPSFAVLVAARALQGAFGALLAPSALSLLTTTFTDEDERGRAFGVFGAISGSGAGIGLLLGGALTDLLSWRWSLYVNLVFAAVAVAGALALLHTVREPGRPRLDLPGTLSVSAGLFCLVNGFSNAETHSWGATLTIVMIAAGLALLVVFTAIERRVAGPLLPLRVVLDRTRGGSYLAIGIAAAGMFGIFLFLTYYLQGTLGYSPLRTGFAFLPLIGAIVLAATSSAAKIMPRTGPRPLVVVGMLLACAALALLTGVGTDTPYASHVLPSLIIAGLGFGMIMAPSIASATDRVQAKDAGVASALVTTMQQIGGSLAIALLSMLAADATSNYVTDHPPPSPTVLAHAAVDGYHTAFWTAAAFFLAGAIACGVLIRSGPPTRDHPVGH